jgi:integrase
VQRIRGQLLQAPVKTRAGQRGLPLLDVVHQALKLQAERQDAYRADMGAAWPDLGLVFTTRAGRPIEPRNLVRSFLRICDPDKIRIIKVHHLRHTVGSLLIMSRVASDASFGWLREHALPAAQRAALGRARSRGSPCTLRDLGCHRPLASGRTMMQPVRLQQIPA